MAIPPATDTAAATRAVLRGAAAAAVVFTLLALILTFATGGFRTGTPTADTGAMMLLAPLVLAILLGVIAVGAGIAASIGAAAAIVATRRPGWWPAVACVAAAAGVGALTGSWYELGDLAGGRAWLGNVVGAVLWGLPVWAAIALARGAARGEAHAGARRPDAVPPRPQASARPGADATARVPQPLPPSDPAVSATRPPAAAQPPAAAARASGPVVRARALRTSVQSRSPAPSSSILHGRTVPLVMLAAGGAVLAGGLLMVAPDLAMETALGWLLQPWLAIGTAGMFDADRVVDPSRIVVAGAIGAAINLPLAYLAMVALVARLSG